MPSYLPTSQRTWSLLVNSIDTKSSGVCVWGGVGWGWRGAGVGGEVGRAVGRAFSNRMVLGQTNSSGNQVMEFAAPQQIDCLDGLNANKHNWMWLQNNQVSAESFQNDTSNRLGELSDSSTECGSQESSREWRHGFQPLPTQCDWEIQLPTPQCIWCLCCFPPTAWNFLMLVISRLVISQLVISQLTVLSVLTLTL